MTLADLEASLSMLRRQGVKAYTDIAGGGFTVEFFPAEPAPSPAEKPKGNEPDMCACGHPEHAHVNGYCVEGCEAAACKDKDEKP